LANKFLWAEDGGSYIPQPHFGRDLREIAAPKVKKERERRGL